MERSDTFLVTRWRWNLGGESAEGVFFVFSGGCFFLFFHDLVSLTEKSDHLQGKRYHENA